MDEWVGLEVRPVRKMAIPLWNFFTGEVMEPEPEDYYGPDDVFVVEHDFRDDGEESGIHLAMPVRSYPGVPERPDGWSPWMAMSSEQFEDVFGADALTMLDSIVELRRS